MGLIPCVLAGCGPGALGSVTRDVEAAAMAAEVLAGTSRLLQLFPDALGKRLAYEGGLEAFLSELSSDLGTRSVVVLVTGDPGLASLATTLARRFPMQPFRRLPGISSIQLAFAEAGLDWMDARILRAHGSLPAWDEAWRKHFGPFAVLAGVEGASRFTADLAVRLGRRILWRCERLGLEDQRVTRLEPEELAREGCDPLSVLIIEGEAP